MFMMSDELGLNVCLRDVGKSAVLSGRGAGGRRPF